LRAVVQAAALVAAVVLVGIERQTVLAAAALLLKHPWYYFRRQATLLRLVAAGLVPQIAVVEAATIPYFLPLRLSAAAAAGRGLEQEQDYLVALAVVEQALTARLELGQPIKVFLVA
jgi:hypothetical protein